MPAMLVEALRGAAELVVSGATVRGWSSYDIKTSITQAPGTFSMQLPFDREAWDLCVPDALVQVAIAGVPVVNGWIDDSDGPEDNEVLDVHGRCRLGRLIDESAPGLTFAGLDLLELAKQLGSPFFAEATISNARNRNLVRGRGRKARAASEPIKVNTKLAAQIAPNQTRYAALQQLLEQAGYLVWSSGDGRELILGKPNYSQEVQYYFFRAAPGSARAAENTVLGMGIRRSTAERYSRVIVVGSGKGTDTNYGATVASRYGQALNNPARADGAGKDFSVPKRLVVQRQVHSVKEARELAEREMARRDAAGQPVTVRCQGHGQVFAGVVETVFAPDTLALVEDERTGLKGIYALTSCNFRSSREGAEETVIELVPKGAELTP